MIDRTQVRLSEQCRIILERWKQGNQIGDMIDGYRLGISISLAVGAVPDELPQNSVTYVSVSTLDPEGDLRGAIRLLSDTEPNTEYHLCEKLACWGIKYLNDRCPDGSLDLSSLLVDQP
jgi:hypothetical protein